MTRKLSPRQQRFIAEIQKGVPGVQAAIAAGYSVRSAKHAAYQLLHENKLVRAELERVRQQLVALTEYNGERCMAECDDGIAFARRTDNANAFARLVELKARLTGLLREKVDITVERIDVTDALAAARARVDRMRPPCDLPPAIEGEFQQLPGIPGRRSIDCESTGRND
ncbi:MAG TPA: terminase small subunit [Frateuria sp.]|uniref:terminase small subunit n=1 Tax=Frateuria sp. TaxID=2211372 RepID=UPI002D7F647E|nr:terminase small subunit [Frateuria sp.]HET6807280.1 terminase small subunit [Frateuria sp.]